MTRRILRTRWRAFSFTLGRTRLGPYVWRAGLIRGEWWIGARRDLAADAWMVGILGAVVVIGHG